MNDGADSESTLGMENPGEAPERIGPYKILQKIGEGGMGVVYLAEQEKPIRRRVALKIIKLGMDTRQVVGRFEAERQALALMNHANVAKVFDAGATEQGRPYFVMEHVKGVPITTHCDTHRLTTTERLELFIQVCEGVQHAHQTGIIHRDLKPSNVLVSIEGDQAVPKIIDFGVAKATEHRLTEKTLFTELGVMIGTPEYMSPEQADLTAQDVDARTDVYSLGVLLYELLVGALPFDPKALREAGFDEIRRKIREEEPSKPSARLSTLGERSVDTVRRRRTTLPTLKRELSGDLDWTTMKALDKDRTRRYASPSELSDDIQRFLTHRPILAGPPSRILSARKFVIRHKLATFTTSILVGAALIVSGAIATVVVTRDRANTRNLRTRLEALASDRTLGTPQSREALAAELVKEVGSDPEGELATLVRGLVAQVDVSVPAFGLVSEPPRISFEDVEFLYFGRDLQSVGLAYWIADIEFSWDGQSWRPFATFCHHPRISATCSSSLNDIPGEHGVVAGPHNIEFRARYAFVDASIDSDRWSSICTSPCEDGTFRDRIPQSLRPTTHHEFQRDLGAFSVSLFDEYPEDFPVRVSLVERSYDLTESFRIDRVTLFQVRIPPGIGERLRFDAVALGIPWLEVTVPDEAKNMPGYLLGYELTGRFDMDSSLPIAANAVVLGPGGGPPLLDTPLVFGAGASLAGMSARFHGVGSSISRDLRPAIPLPKLTPDGTYQGRIELRPSRELALSTLRFDRYVGDLLRFDIEIRYQTIDAEWTEIAEETQE